MEYLLAGLIKFRSQDFEKHKELFTSLKNNQYPHTLFITCSDSRVVPQLITESLPGELFVVRNIANIIPPYQEAPASEAVASTVASALEYGVKVLKVKNIIVCGHSNCGGCAAIHLADEDLKELPATKKWLELAGSVKTKVLAEMNLQGKSEDMKYREWLTEQINIVEQIKHLLTYPYVAEGVRRKELEIIGMYYKIATGEVFLYDPRKGLFELAN